MTLKSLPGRSAKQRESEAPKELQQEVFMDLQYHETVTAQEEQEYEPV